LNASSTVGSFFGKLGMRAGPDVEEMWRGFSSLNDVGARAAFIHTLRGIVDPGGQRVNATDRLYLAERMPTMLMWGERDPIIPIEHGLAAQKLIPDSRFETFAGAGHFPHRTDPRAFVRALDDFIETTEPAEVSEDDFRDLLRSGGYRSGRRSNSLPKDGLRGRGAPRRSRGRGTRRSPAAARKAE
jgi:hypothetical protein